MSTIRHEQAGDANKPSPRIWHRFPLTRMNELGLGHFFHEEFLAFPVDIVASGEQRPQVGFMELECDDDTVLAAAADLGGRVDIETDADDNDAWSLFTRPFCKTVLNSGKPWAFEVAATIGDVAQDAGLFIGLMENAGLSRDAVADDGLVLVGESLIGFHVMGDDPNEMDSVYKLDAGTVVQMLGDVNQSAAITADGGTVASLTNDTLFKAGMSFDGKQTIRSYFDGHLVFSHDIGSSTTIFPDGVDMGLIIALKTGTTAAESMELDWTRGAYLESN